MMKFGIVLAASSILAFMIGCASSGPPEAGMEHPNPVSPKWVSSPYVEDGMAATECVDATAPMSIIKGEAASLARAALASELKTGLEDLKVNYQSRRQTEADAGFSIEYDRVTRDLARQTLVGSRVARADYATIRDQEQFCVMVIIDKKHSDVMREKLFAQAGMEVSPEDEVQLWEAFLLDETDEKLSDTIAKQK